MDKLRSIETNTRNPETNNSAYEDKTTFPDT